MAETKHRAAVERLEAELKRNRERIDRLEVELREARAAADAWAARYVELVEHTLDAAQQPDRPAKNAGHKRPEKRADPEAAAPARNPTKPDAGKPPRTPEAAAGVVENIARGILGDALPNVVFGHRK